MASGGKANLLQGPPPKKATKFDLAHLFPPHPKVKPRGPLPKQRLVFIYIAKGICRDGGIVYQGGKGCAKTLGAAGVDIWAHQKFPGLRSAVGRESYPSLCTSTWDEYKQMLERLPPGSTKSVSKPSHNSMGVIEWPNGGVTLLVSLSDSKTWESANLGLAVIDEGHLQREDIIDKLCTRLRQDSEDVTYPRLALIVTNPCGRHWIWRWANPKSPSRLPGWAWIEASMFENPALPDGYIAGMEARYKPGTPAHKRWVLGKSTQLEGSVLGEIFDPDPDALVHVVPDFKLPPDWRCGRGLDWGIDNPCSVSWGALDNDGCWWIYRGHNGRGRSATWHGEAINELEKDEPICWTPADPEIFRKIHPDGNKGTFYSTADEFWKVGTRVTPANNNRAFGLSVILDLFKIDPDKIHPCSLVKGSPHIFILDNPSNQFLIDSLEMIEWRPEPSTGSSGAPDDVAKKHDHGYDGLRYLVAERPEVVPKAPVKYKPREARGTRGYRGYSGRRA